MFFKKYSILFYLLLFIHALYADVIKQPSYQKILTPPVPYTLKKAQSMNISAIKDSIPNYFEEKSGSIRGKSLENFFNRTYYQKWKHVDVTYNNGHNGLDGLYVRYDKKTGNIKQVIVNEIKSGNAKLNIKNKQMTKGWILKDVNKAIKWEKNHANSPEKIQQLKQVRNLIEHDQYRRQLTRINLDYKKGNITTKITKITGETKSGRIILDKHPSMKERISYLKRNQHKLNTRQKKFIKILLSEINEGLKNLKKNKTQRIKYLKTLRNGIPFQKTTIESFIIQMKNRGAIFEIELLNRAAVGLSVLSELSALKDYIKGNITASDFIFHSISNSIVMLAYYMPSLNPLLTPIFIAIETTKNIYDYKTGRISKEDMIINTTATTIGFVSGGLAVWGVSLLAAEIGGTFGTIFGTPIGGFIIGSIAFTTAFLISSIAVKLTGQAIVSMYETRKQPERFLLCCGDVRHKYNLLY